MVDKTKQAPIPEKTGSAQPERGSQKGDKQAYEQRDPTFVRGTVDPTTRK